MRTKIRRYLEYNLNIKEQQKIDKEDVMKALNKNLQIQMQGILNGNILKNIKVFMNFNLDFLSSIADSFKPQTFSAEENVVEEGEPGGTMYFIVTGWVSVLHKDTQTYIKDLKNDDYFGEIGFFSAQTRTTTVKARDFS
jgi:CRP-like cAMP-binding protein